MLWVPRARPAPPAAAPTALRPAVIFRFCRSLAARSDWVGFIFAISSSPPPPNSRSATSRNVSSVASSSRTVLMCPSSSPALVEIARKVGQLDFLDIRIDPDHLQGPVVRDLFAFDVVSVVSTAGHPLLVAVPRPGLVHHGLAVLGVVAFIHPHEPDI